ncbi:hypothetical protein H634G_10875 [Metarhizium anisopliae BRIP 53293]|uniref:Uncharacterized protein n=1 Tax=Metarhizium anisopliae BRIP 53293 TaxID=1291518 RepID=A0A0D9NIN8_METAN|nr:hypothetical protein H634G_10875 [Metarhizium anisopliae BRIP 53293]KJK88377.1 hypothetical protein H633G_07767 [Metarhizium anisopliae BRIP 53284]
MSRPLHNQKPTSPATRSATPDSQVEAHDEGLWMKRMRKSNYKKDPSEKDPSTSLRRGRGIHDISSNEQSAVASSDIAETVSRKIHTTDDLEKARARLVSEVQKLGLRNDESHENPAHASNKLEDADTEGLVQVWDSSKDVPAGSVLEKWTEEDRMKWAQGTGIDMNDLLDKLPIHKRCTSSTVLGDRSEDYGVMDVNDCHPPWIETISGDEMSAKNMALCDNEYHGISIGRLSGISLTPPPCKDTYGKTLQPVPFSAVGTPTVAVSDNPPLAKPDATWGTGVDCDLNDGSRKMTEEDIATLGLLGWWKESNVNTGLPPINKENFPGLENVRTLDWRCHL